jgi:hypothetical protein
MSAIGVGVGLVWLFIAGASGANADPAWSVTWTSSTRTSPGNGTTSGSKHTTVMLTPTEENISTDSEGRDAEPEHHESKKALDPKQRAAIEALLPKLAKLSGGTFSLSKYVDDEGSRSESLTVVFGAKMLHFGLAQGSRYPQPPDEIRRLYKLVAGRELPAE